MRLAAPPDLRAFFFAGAFSAGAGAAGAAGAVSDMLRAGVGANSSRKSDTGWDSGRTAAPARLYRAELRRDWCAVQPASLAAAECPVGSRVVFVTPRKMLKISKSPAPNCPVLLRKGSPKSQASPRGPVTRKRHTFMRKTSNISHRARQISTLRNKTFYFLRKLYTDLLRWSFLTSHIGFSKWLGSHISKNHFPGMKIFITNLPLSEGSNTGSSESPAYGAEGI